MVKRHKETERGREVFMCGYEGERERDGERVVNMCSDRNIEVKLPAL